MLRPSSEYPPGRDKRFGQNINLFEGIVHGKRSAAGGGDAEALEQRLGAMGSGAHGHTGAVDHGGHIMGMGALHGEGDDGALVAGAAEDAERVDFRQALHGMVAQLGLVRGDGLPRPMPRM